MLYGMEPAESDWYTQGGFWLSVAGVAVSAIGLGATYYQVRKARKSADAARDAAELTRQQSQDAFRYYLAAALHRQLVEVAGFVTTSRWDFASLRCEDIGAIVAQLTRPEVADEYRYFARLFRDKVASDTRRVGVKRWNDLMISTQRRVDEITSPFANKGSGP